MLDDNQFSDLSRQIKALKEALVMTAFIREANAAYYNEEMDGDRTKEELGALIRAMAGEDPRLAERMLTFLKESRFGKKNKLVPDL